MKVLLANHVPLIGSTSGTNTLNLALHLHALGHSVTVLTPEHGIDSGYPFEVRNLIFSNGTNAEYDVDFNFPCFTPHPRSETTFYELTDDQVGEYIAAWDDALTRAVRDVKPDILHTQHAWVTPFCARKLRIPYVLTVQGADLMGLRNDERFVDMVQSAVAGASSIIAVSRQVHAEALELLKIPDRKTIVIHHGFDENIFQPKTLDRPVILAQHGIKTDAESLVVFADELTRFKGVDVLLKAAALYEDELDLVATVIAGTGELEDELKAVAGEFCLKDTHFVGATTSHRIAELYNVADVVAVPSRVEPFGFRAMEALACGTPVVATQEGGLPDFVSAAVGALVDVDDPRALADAIMEQIRTGAKKTKGPHAAGCARDSFAWSKVADRVAWVYEDALSKEV